MIPEIFAGSDWFTGTHLSKREYVQQSDVIICISQSTRDDLLRIYGDVSAEIFVIPCAVGSSFSPGLDPLPSLPRDYLLYVGGRKGYKDFILLPEAMRQLKDGGIEVPVVVIGPAFTPEESLLFERFGVGDLFHQHSLDDAGLRRAMSNSMLLIQTSRYEGFGMTPLEGMASGIPVVIANSSSMPEVGGNVARYFSPGDAGELAERIAELVISESLRSDLGLLGRARSRLFTAHLMAERTANAYQTLV
jgi:glycosyltransferase involved in cell wall biosynthesis